MPNEAPFISKALRLVSLAIIVATISIAATAAYSGYEEYGALTTSVQGTSSSQLSLAINGSTLTLSGLQVPNKMTFPLTLELLGSVSLDNATIGNFDTGTYVIQPNTSRSISISIPLSFQSLLKDSRALQMAAFNSTDLSINTTISAHMVPLLGINITKAANTTAGPILGGLSESINTNAIKVSPDGKSVLVPLVLTWQNTSPLSGGEFWLNANVTQMPGKPLGNYGSANGPLNFTSGQNQQSFELNLPISDFSGKNLPRGMYSIETALSQSSSSQPFLKINKSVSV